MSVLVCRDYRSLNRLLQPFAEMAVHVISCDSVCGDPHFRSMRRSACRGQSSHSRHSPRQARMAYGAACGIAYSAVAPMVRHDPHGLPPTDNADFHNPDTTPVTEWPAATALMMSSQTPRRHSSILAGDITDKYVYLTPNHNHHPHSHHHLMMIVPQSHPPGRWYFLRDGLPHGSAIVESCVFASRHNDSYVIPPVTILNSCMFSDGLVMEDLYIVAIAPREDGRPGAAYGISWAAMEPMAGPLLTI